MTRKNQRRAALGSAPRRSVRNSERRDISDVKPRRTESCASLAAGGAAPSLAVGGAAGSWRPEALRLCFGGITRPSKRLNIAAREKLCAEIFC